MNQAVIVTGMVLLSAAIGEYDKRVVILTKERGKISVFARGARRPNNHLMGLVNPFSFGRFELYEGRDSYTLKQGEIANYFTEIRTDMEASCYGMYFMEFASYYTREANDETQALKLLYQTIRTLCTYKIPLPLIRCIYELKLICINGEGPQVKTCMKCKKEAQNVYFNTRMGGVICAVCEVGKTEGIIKLHTSTLYALQYIVGSTVEKLYSFTVSEEVLAQLQIIMKQYIAEYVDKKFKTLEILEQITTTSTS